MHYIILFGSAFYINYFGAIMRLFIYSVLINDDFICNFGSKRNAKCPLLLKLFKYICDRKSLQFSCI